MVTRRQFLLSSMATVGGLATVSACSSGTAQLVLQGSDRIVRKDDVALAKSVPEDLPQNLDSIVGLHVCGR